jgi:GT2 family glycosyltransferase
MKIAAVFASYNRREVALEAAEKLRAQTRPLDWVVVGDNASEDGTAEALRALDWEALEVLDTGDNLGNAGAIRLAMDRAFDLGADAVWVLDDDSWPRPETLEVMMRDGWNSECVLHSLQIDPANGRFTWPLQLIEAGGGVRLVNSLEGLPPGRRVRSRGAWTGALIPWRIRQRVGPVMGELFIRGEDEEYPWRIEQAGFRSEAVTGAFLDHPGPENMREWKCCGKRLFLEKGLAPWKLYYRVRNMVWLKKRQSGSRGAAAMALAYGVALATTEGRATLGTWWTAARDGWRGRLGRKDFDGA